MPTDYVTPDYLKTMVGMVAVVTLLTQFVKSFVKRIFRDSTVRVVAWMIAFSLQMVVLCFSGGLGGPVKTFIGAIGLGVINSIIVTMAAHGTYEMLSDPMALREKPPTVVRKLYR